MKFYSLVLSLFGLVCAQLSIAQNLTPPDIELETFYTSALSPVGIYNCGDNRLFILEKDEGDIEIITNTGTAIGKFLDLTGSITTGGERGLLGLAFHPNYLQNGLFYVNYTNTSGHTVVKRFQVSADPNVADPNSGFTILTVNQPYSNHNGGHIAFGPDGYLYIGMGDGGSSGDPQARSQNPLELLGKMLRIDVDNGSPYSIPETNPFYGQSDTLPEIWSLGLRNPWKWSFDRATGDMWIGDVGQNAWEEIDFQPAGMSGMNFGWRCYEGDATYNTGNCQPQSFYDFPVVDYSHGGNDDFCSITGGMVYRGQNFPALDGLYFFTDYCAGDIHSLTSNGQGGFDDAILLTTGAGAVAFGEDVNGELFLVFNTGTISRIVDSCPFYPSISGTGTGSLQADVGTAYWWYKDGVLIDGATDQTYTPTAPGVYNARVNNGECIRETNSLPFVFVSGIPGCTYMNATNYNDYAEVDDGTCLFSVDCDCPADLDVNGVIGISDLMIFIGEYGSACGE
jgi:glucose/arabinose dehydrogenase